LQIAGCLSLLAKWLADLKAYSAQNPDVEIIRMGIGDVTRPICPAAIEALHAAVEDEANGESFHGLRSGTRLFFPHREDCRNRFIEFYGINIDVDEIFC